MSVGRYPAVALLILFAAAACGDSDDLSADAGSDFEVTVGEAPNFDGCGSSGSIETYSWVITGAPDSMRQDEGKPLNVDDGGCSFVLDATMGLDEVGTWVIELTVDDGSDTATDEVTVEVVDA